ncbi:MAG: 5'/3'-nucleotidase SurE [Alphaproteobacteria bacterium]|nr:5'/3'-nucleotidase SurE [Pseudomonadota bacterium]TDI66259.1 MAG: 5'/3'-nucleotidase SurE [Alphaproteobacteria bacterium]
MKKQRHPGGPLDLQRARILVTNDDGAGAQGLRLLVRIAKTLSPDVWVVAPEVEQSAASHSLTVRAPLRVNKLGDRRFSVNGTPTDCVLLAVGQLLADRIPDLVLSGINQGGNLAEDISHSGTVAAAFQATVMGIRGIALSQIRRPQHPVKWSTAEHFAPDLVRRLTREEWQRDVLININFPDRVSSAVSGIEITRQGRRRQIERVTESFDPYGEPYYWIGSPRTDGSGHAGTSDIDAAARGAVSVTPLNLNLTDRATAARLRKAFS